MLKFLKEVVGGSGTRLKDLPCNIGDPYPSTRGSWSQFRGTSRIDDQTEWINALLEEYMKHYVIASQKNWSNARDTVDTGSLGISSMPGNVSLVGWAMSSLTLKGKPSDQAAVASANSVTPATTSTSTASSGLMETPLTAPVHSVSSSTEFADQAMPASPTSTDRWGEIENGIHEEQDSDKDGWDDIEPLEEPKPSPPPANIQAAQKRPVSQPVSQPKPQGTSLRPKGTVKVVKDEDDELWGSIAAAPPISTSKPLNVKTAVAIDDDDPWAAIAAPPPTTEAKPFFISGKRQRN